MKHKRLRYLSLFFLNMILFLSQVGCSSGSVSDIHDNKYFSSSRTLRIGLVDYGSNLSNNDYRDFIATHYDLIVENNLSTNLLWYKEKNPDLIIFCYWNSVFITPEDFGTINESAFLHNDPNSLDLDNRICLFYFDEFKYIMNTESSFWQEYSLQKINSLLDLGFDGVHLDDFWAHLFIRMKYDTIYTFIAGTKKNYIILKDIPSWYDPQESHDGWTSYIQYLTTNLDKLVIYNGINDIAENNVPTPASYHTKNYLGYADGSVQEGFVYENGYLGDEYWEAIVDILVSIPTDKIHGVVSYGDVNDAKARLFAFASYLIGYNHSGKTSYYYSPDVFSLVYLPEWDLNLGRPLVSHNSIFDYKDPSTGVFWREFENGLVIVNPYGTPVSNIKLDDEYMYLEITQNINVKTTDGISKVAIGSNDDIQFKKVRSIDLDKYSAAILMK